MFLNRKKILNRRVKTRPKLYRLSRSFIDWIKLAVLIIVTGGAIYGAYHWFVVSDFFCLRRITVISPTPHLTEEAIVKLSGLELGKNLLGLRLHRVESSLKRMSWIKNVRVKRNLPSEIILQVEEYQPFAILKMEECYLVSREGEIFRKMRNGEKYDLPLITGFKKEEFERFPGYYRLKLKEVHSFLTDLIISGNSEKAGISRLHYDLAGGFTIFTKAPLMEVFFGKGDLDRKREEWSRFLRQEGMIYQNIDLHVADKIFAKI